MHRRKEVGNPVDFFRKGRLHLGWKWENMEILSNHAGGGGESPQIVLPRFFLLILTWKTAAVLHYMYQYSFCWDSVGLDIKDLEFVGMDPNCCHPKLRPTTLRIFLTHHYLWSPNNSQNILPFPIVRRRTTSWKMLTLKGLFLPLSISQLLKT